MSVKYTSTSRSRRGIGRAGAFTLAEAALPLCALAQATFTVMPPPPTPGFQIQGVFAVTNDGAVMCAEIDTPVNFALTWHPQKGYTKLPSLVPGGDAIPRFAEPGGRFIPGSAEENDVSRPVLWIDGQAPIKLADPPPGYTLGYATGVSWDGSVVCGFFSELFNAQAFLWRKGVGVELLGFLTHNDPYSTTRQMGQYGDVILGTSSNGFAVVGARWTTEKGWEDLGALPGGTSSRFYACSRDGRVGVGKSSEGNFEYAVRWTEATGWHKTGGLGVYATGVSGDGWTVTSIGGSNKGYLWDPIDGARYIQDVFEKELGLVLPGWIMRSILAISDNGRFIAGYGIDPQGALQYYLAEIPPFCYADCDRSTGKGVLDVFDFLCFMNKFNAQDPYGNCDNDGAFDLFDFLCFINHFNEGCGQ